MLIKILNFYPHLFSPRFRPFMRQHIRPFLSKFLVFFFYYSSKGQEKVHQSVCCQMICLKPDMVGVIRFFLLSFWTPTQRSEQIREALGGEQSDSDLWAKDWSVSTQEPCSCDCNENRLKKVLSRERKIQKLTTFLLLFSRKPPKTKHLDHFVLLHHIKSH